MRPTARGGDRLSTCKYANHLSESTAAAGSSKVTFSVDLFDSGHWLLIRQQLESHLRRSL